jgi:hypothetical protein
MRVICEFEPGTVHGHLNTPELDESKASIRRIADWFNQAG